MLQEKQIGFMVLSHANAPHPNDKAFSSMSAQTGIRTCGNGDANRKKTACAKTSAACSLTVLDCADNPNYDRFRKASKPKPAIAKKIEDEGSGIESRPISEP